MTKIVTRLLLVFLICSMCLADPKYDLPLAYKIELKAGETIKQVAIVKGVVYVLLDQTGYILYYYRDIQKMTLKDRKLYSQMSGYRILKLCPSDDFLYGVM